MVDIVFHVHNHIVDGLGLDDTLPLPLTLLLLVVYRRAVYTHRVVDAHVRLEGNGNIGPGVKD